MTTDLDTLFIGKEHIHIDELVSTNAHAQYVLSKSNPSEGTVITASYQAQGRGQIGRLWYSSKSKNVLCSVILRPKFLKAKDQFYLNMAISCALRACISDILPNKNIYIKWPNDIYVDDKKIAGILIQNTLIGSLISNTIVGIGINVNEDSFPKSLPNPTSLKLISICNFNIDQIQQKLFSFLERYYLILRAGKIDDLRTEYISHLYQSGTLCEFTKEDGTPFHGTIKFVDNQGKLVLLVDGKEQHFSFREVRLKVNS